MPRIAAIRAALPAACLACLALALASCASQPTAEQIAAEQRLRDQRHAQATLTDMADDYITRVAEAIYLLPPEVRNDPRRRVFLQSFLRNAFGAALDIATHPNPNVAILDLLVLSSLQRWSFENHWMPIGIGEEGRPVLASLESIEAELWVSAEPIFTEQQLATLRDLIDTWIDENPDRTVVSYIRFSDYEEERFFTSADTRARASGLLREVSEATDAIEDARLLAERLLWLSTRYPYLLGQQTELTTYRLLNQPEFAQLTDSARSLNELSQRFSTTFDPLEIDFTQDVYDAVAELREKTVLQARQALEELIADTLDETAARIAAERDKTLDQLFDRITIERNDLLDTLDEREDQLLSISSELRQTAQASEALATQLTTTINAADTLAQRFDPNAHDGEHMQIDDLRTLAQEATRAAEQLTRVLEISNNLIDSGKVDQSLSTLADPLNDVVDRAFWRAVILIIILLLGLALLKLIPHRTTRPAPKPAT